MRRMKRDRGAKRSAAAGQSWDVVFVQPLALPMRCLPPGGVAASEGMAGPEPGRACEAPPPPSELRSGARQGCRLSVDLRSGSGPADLPDIDQHAASFDGSADGAGLGGRAPRPRGKANAKRCVIHGREYPSIAAAARALRVGYTHMARELKAGPSAEYWQYLLSRLMQADQLRQGRAA